MKMFALAIALMLPCVAAGPAGEKGKSVGNPTASMRMDLYSDFTCPHCKMLHEQLLSRIMQDYVTPGKAYLVFHEYTLSGPGHEHSRTASLYAAAAARLGKYQQVSDALFQAQSSWAVSGKVWETVSPALTPAEQKRVQALIKDPSVIAEVQQDLDTGNAAQVDRTPTLVMTRKGKTTLWSNWSDYGLFRSLVDLLLSK
jgi:protein-disulfide isomerase